MGRCTMTKSWFFSLAAGRQERGKAADAALSGRLLRYVLGPAPGREGRCCPRASASDWRQFQYGACLSRPDTKNRLRKLYGRALESEVLEGVDRRKSIRSRQRKNRRSAEDLCLLVDQERRQWRDLQPEGHR